VRTTTYEQILLEVTDGVAVVTLNRPDRMNAYTWRMGAELQHAFVTLDRDDGVRAIVVTGAGKAFCAGADLEAGGETFASRMDADRASVREELDAPETRPWELGTPIIAALNGHAVGVGITLPLQWDMRIVAEEAKIGFVFNRRGIIPEANSQWILPRLVGMSRALDLLITGRVFSGAEAASYGIALEALPADQVLPRALEVARDIAKNTAPVSVAITKRLMYEQLADTDRIAAQDRESRLFGWAGRQADAREGISAFLDKRDPDWKLGKASDFPEDVFSER
jgi:enoyl-CoA hydratase/carnithine racemase